MKNKEIINIFWTGGYDSTFRICQALIDENKIVQPIYISDIIDNEKDSDSKKRNNHEYEYKSRCQIRKELFKSFPKLKGKFLPVKNIKKIKIDKEIKFHMNNLYNKKKVRRPICQYSAMAQFCKNINKKSKKKVLVETSLEKNCNNKFTLSGNNIFDEIILQKKKYIFKKNKELKTKSYKIFKYFTFPLFNYTKQDMLEVSKKKGYDHILKLTWTCWYPEDGKSCEGKRCNMCKNRILEHNNELFKGI